jgi:hypothetical protein
MDRANRSNRRANTTSNRLLAISSQTIAGNSSALQRERNLRSNRAVSLAVNMRIVLGAGSVESSLENGQLCCVSSSGICLVGKHNMESAGSHWGVPALADGVCNRLRVAFAHQYREDCSGF